MDLLNGKSYAAVIYYLEENRREQHLIMKIYYCSVWYITLHLP